MMLWLDMETTGLDHRVDSVLEIGLMLATDDLMPVTSTELLLAPQRKRLTEAEDIVQRMHEASGLTADLLAKGGMSISLATAILTDWLDVVLPAGEKLPMCGSSVGFDRRFLLEYMPSIEDRFHYRNIDVSTIKELVERWYPGERDLVPVPDKMHRVMADIADSINELRFYRDRYMVPFPELAA